MFFRKIISRSNGKEYTYLKLIQNYREDGKVKQRVVANLGNIENLTPEKVEGLIAGLRKVCGFSNRPSQSGGPAPEQNNVLATGLSSTYGLSGNSIRLEANKVLRYGEVLAIHKIWEILDMPGAIKQTFFEEKSDLNTALLVELMVMNQIIKPQNKQVISDWYHCLYLPELEGKELLPHHFYRVLDSIARDKEVLERQIFERMKAVNPVDTDIAFCLLTTGTIEPSPHYELNVSSYGKYFFEEPAKDTKVDLGIMVSRDGMPFGHKMFQMATEERNYRDTVNYAKNNYGTNHCIFVGDRNFMLNQNIEVLIAQGYEYLIRRKSWKKQDLDLLAREMAPGKKDFRVINEDLWFKEVQKDDARYLLCFNPQGAEQKKILLNERLDEIEVKLKAIQKTVDENREKNVKSPFNKNNAVFKDKNCLKYFDLNYDKAAKRFSYRRKYDLVEQDQKIAGLFMLETNSYTLSGQELLESYINLAQIGESFREIKNFEARPNQLKAELNISANILVCVLAATIEKTLERIIRGAGINLNSRQTLELLEEIKVTVNQLGDQEVKSVTRIQKAQREILQAVGASNL